MNDGARDPRLERALDELRAREPAWDSLRERRALARIEATLGERGGARDRAPARRWRPAIVAGIAALAAVVLLLLWLRPPATAASEPDAAVTLAAELVPEPIALPIATPSIPSVTAPTLALADGSIATLHDGARIELATQSAAMIRVRQSSGRVHYEVRPGLPRTFVVALDGVEVTVIGTAFWVTRETDAVRVTVEHGHVRVARTGIAEVADLHAGDELRLELVGVATTVDAIEPPPAARATDRSRRPAKAAPVLAPTVAAEPTPAPDVDALLAAADAALARGDRAAAAAALDTLVREHGDDPRAYGAAFQLGKIERARGRHRAAAAAFLAATRKSPGGALSEDARAEAALELFASGDLERARAAAADYLAHHPAGVHVDRIEAMRAQLP